MDAARLKQLASQSDLLVVVELADTVEAFLLGFLAGSDYDSSNYRWFDERFRNYFYVDRIVVSEACRGRGMAKALYEQIGRFAVERGCHWLAAEVNLEPPNPVSQEFHRKAGFLAVATKAAGPGKVLSMLIRAARVETGHG